MTDLPRKVFITKYALSNGIEEREVHDMDGNCTFVIVKNPDSLGGRDLVRNEFVHGNWLEAVEHANELRARRIASLEKSISKLRKLTFEKVRR